ncbi:MAG: hypothetical protein ABUL62_12820 [Myxococcales bacterium]
MATLATPSAQQRAGGYAPRSACHARLTKPQYFAPRPSGILIHVATET